jgi:hypothetical protein
MFVITFEEGWLCFEGKVAQYPKHFILRDFAMEFRRVGQLEFGFG